MELIALTFSRRMVVINVPAILYSSVMTNPQIHNHIDIERRVFPFSDPATVQFQSESFTFVFTTLTILCAVYFVETKITVIAQVLFNSLNFVSVHF
jgi:hypothetical protein